MKKACMIVATSFILLNALKAMESASPTRPLVKYATQLETWYNPTLVVTEESGKTRYHDLWFQHFPDTAEGNFFAAVLMGDEAAVGLFLAMKDINVNWQAPCFVVSQDGTKVQAVVDGGTALLHALWLSRFHIFNRILAHPKTSVNIADYLHITPLILAVKTKSPLAFFPIIEHPSFDFNAHNQGKRALVRAQKLKCSTFTIALEAKQQEAIRAGK